MAPRPKSPKEDIRFASNNFAAVFDSNNFDERVKIMIEILRHSLLNTPFTKVTTTVPEKYIVKAYKTASVQSSEDCIHFKLFNDQDAVLTKNIFLRSIGLSFDSSIEFDAYPTDAQLIDFLIEIGYDEEQPSLGDIKKARFPPIWHLVVHFVIRCLSGKVGGTDSIIKDYLYIIWGLYCNKQVDVGSILWKDFKSFVARSRNDIPSSRFWSLCLKRIYAKADISIDENAEMYESATIGRHKVNSKCPREIRRLPDHMLGLLHSANPILQMYLRDSAHLVPAEHNQSPPFAVEAKSSDQQLPKTTEPQQSSKRKGVIFSSPPKKKKPHQSSSTVYLKTAGEFGSMAGSPEQTPLITFGKPASLKHFFHIHNITLSHLHCTLVW